VTNGPGFLPLLTPKYHVDLIEHEGQHFYTVDKNPTYLPGVTGILNCIAKEALLPWCARETALYMNRIFLKIRGKRDVSDRFLETMVKRAKKQPKFIKEQAARVGTHAHKVFDGIINLAKDPGSTPYLDSFMHWLSTERLKIVQGDTKVASLKYGYGGSLDVLLQDGDGRYIIGDFKTGKYLYDSHSYQVSAYSQGFMETYGIDYRPEGVIIRFERDKPSYERRETRDINDSFLAFKAAKDLCEAQKLVHFQNRELIKKAKKEKANERRTISA
jgi:hypothetical protein